MKQTHEPKNLIVESLRLLDKNGKMRAILSTADNGMPYFRMFDDQVRPLVSIALDRSDEAHIALLRKSGEFLAGIQTFYDDGRVMLMVMNHAGKCVFKIDFDPIDYTQNP